MVDRTRQGGWPAPDARPLRTSSSPVWRGTWCQRMMHLMADMRTGHAVHAHPTGGLDCPSYSVVVLAQWQLVSLHEVPVSPSIQVSQPFGPAWGEFGPLPVASLQETATEDADASGQARHDSTRSEEHTSELQVTNAHLVCRLLLEKKK